MNKLTNNEKVLIKRIQDAFNNADIYKTDYYLCQGTVSVGVCLNKFYNDWIVSVTDIYETKRYKFSSLKEAVPLLIRKVTRSDDKTKKVLFEILYSQNTSLTYDEIQKIIRINYLLIEHKIMASNYSICEGNIDETEYEGCTFLNKENEKWLTYKINDGKRSNIKEFDQLNSALENFIYEVTLNWKENVRTKFDNISDYLLYNSGQTPDENTGKKIFVSMFVYRNENEPLTKEEDLIIQRLVESLKLNNINSNFYSIRGTEDNFETICINKYNNKWYVYYIDEEGYINHICSEYDNIDDAVKHFIHYYLGVNDLTDGMISSIFEQKQEKIIRLKPEGQ